MGTLVDNTTDTPATQCEAVKQQAEAIEIMRDTAGGTLKMRAAGTKYLPRNDAESPNDYNARLKRAVFFNGVSRTVQGMAGMICRRDPELGPDVPPLLVTHWENIDQMGTHGDVFTRRFTSETILAGPAGVLVDMEPWGRPRSAGAEREAGLRPYWAMVPKDRVVSFRKAKVRGEVVFTQLVLSETTEEPAGTYANKTVTRYRVFERDLTSGIVTWRLMRKDDAGAWVEDAGGTVRNQSAIPFVLAGTFEDLPPLLDLAELDIAHWQTMADYLTGIHMADVPVRVAIGLDQGQEDPDEIVVDWKTFLKMPMGGDFKFAETSGAALGVTRQALEDLKADMATMGLAMLQGEKRAAETAEAKRIDKASSDSALASIARSVQDALEAALQLHANYLKLGSGGSVTINREFEELTLDPATIVAYSDLVAKGQLSLDTLWATLAAGNALPEDFDPEVEKDRLESEDAPPSPSGFSAESTAATRAAEAALARARTTGATAGEEDTA